MAANAGRALASGRVCGALGGLETACVILRGACEPKLKRLQEVQTEPERDDELITRSQRQEHAAAMFATRLDQM